MSLKRTDVLHGLVAGALATALVFGSYVAGAQSERWNGLIVTANEKAHSLSLIDAATSEVQTIPLQIAPHNVQASADGRYVYTTGAQAMDMSGMDMKDMKMDMPGMLLAFDLQRLWTGPVLSLPVGEHPAHVVVDAQNRFAYVTVSGEDVVKVVDLTNRSIVAAIPVGAMPHGLRISPDASRLYVSDMNGDAVSFVDVGARKEIARVPVGKSPVQVAVAPDGRRVYVTLSGENSVAEIDVAKQRSTRRIRVGRNPAQLFIAPDGARLYVANQGTAEKPDHTLSVVDTRSFHVIATVNVADGAHGVAVTPDGAHVFVTNAFASRLSEIDARTFAVRSYAVGSGPNGVTLVSK